jgi:hypothetical protein
MALDEKVMFDFFLAHSSRDGEVAERLYKLLDPHAKVFLDSKCLKLGDDWDLKLQHAQRSSRVTVVLVSSKTEAAYYEREEIAAALQMARQDGQKHRVVPVYLDSAVLDNGEVPYGLRLKHGLTLDISRDLTAVAEGLRELLSQIGEPTSVPAELQPDPPSERLETSSTELKSGAYIFYLARERLASLFAQVDADSLKACLDHQTTLLPLGQAGVVQGAEGKRRAATQQLFVVLKWLHSRSRIGDLARVAQSGGRLDYDWYFIDNFFSAQKWDPHAALVVLEAQLAGYQLLLSCSKESFVGLQREGQVFVPTSTNAYLFDGTAELPLQGLVRLAAVDRKAKILRGSALYLVLGSDLGHL